MSLLLSMDGALWEIIGVSFRVSLMAMLIAVPPALLIAFVLVRCAFPGRWLLISLINTLMAVPTVVVGLLLFILLSRAGPLGDFLALLFRALGERGGDGGSNEHQDQWDWFKKSHFLFPSAVTRSTGSKIRSAR